MSVSFPVPADIVVAIFGPVMVSFPVVPLIVNVSVPVSYTHLTLPTTD